MTFSLIVTKSKSFWFNMSKTDKWMIAVLIFSFLTRIAFLFYSPHRGWDETVYLNLGHDLSNNPLTYSLKDSLWSDFIPSTDPVYGWPNIGFRAPLLPYLFSLFYFLNLSFLNQIIVPLFGTLSILLTYILGKKLFNEKIAFYSAILFSLVPLHTLFSGKTLTDTFVVFFILLTFISFWEGFERENKKHKILFGLFLALSLLARYTTLWIAPVFLFYFLIRDRSLRFLKDKRLWVAIGVFFLILSPWFIYGIKFYNHPFGAFIHGFKAANYWGGVQEWNFFFENSWKIFSIIGILFIFSLLYVLVKREFIKREIYLLLIWVIFYSLIVMMMPHKEDRFIMPIIPAVCLLSGYFISKISRFRNIIFSLICIVLLCSIIRMINFEINESKAGVNMCFKDGNEFLANHSIVEDALIVTNQSPIVHYYTKKEVALFPDPWNLETFRQKINQEFKNRSVYISFANYDMDMEGIAKKDLDANFEKVFECQKDWGYSAVYEYK